MNKNPRNMIGAAALSAVLSIASLAAAQTQQAVLSGTTNGLSWTLYGPGELNGLSMQSTTLKVAAHPQATVTGAKYDGKTAILAFRVNAPLQTVYSYHDQQLRNQGFQRTAQSMQGNAAQATYTRSGSSVVVNLTRQNDNTYRATFDLSGVKANMANSSNAVTDTTANKANNTSSNTTNANANNNNAAGTTPVLPVTVVGVTKFTPEQNANAGRTALASAKDFAGVTYVLYGPIELNNLTSNPGTVSFSIPQGSLLAETDINVDGTLMARIAGSNLNLQQVMDFYDRQFKAQGFTLVNPTDTGAGGDYALTYIYERGVDSRVSFSVEREFDTYRLVWDFQRS
ncbi:hypothetical protein [Deinococcus aerophilus]|uniref:Uncharacterized protein n=1 Tax=Deinococcus aerophilus TaxID=522488 RepID=A0ABQ2GXK8_9DEIO|nr:hypothetical protein [Deinococcus aerophilus]GGM15916.1 hypothetical protein GCM10010841_25390 [Deinococcus aerophilus]